MKKVLCTLFILLVCLVLSACSFDDFEVISVPENEEVSAIIYHSEMLGIDAGSEYIYYIYKDKNDYLYFKYTSSITIAGSSEEEFVKSGRLKNKEAFSTIENDINADKKGVGESFVSYDYYENKIRTRFKTMDELLEKLY